MVERIEQGIRNGRISSPPKKKVLRGKKKNTDHIKGDYKSKKNHFQNYSPPNHSSQITNLTLTHLFLAKSHESPSNQVSNQAENQSKKFTIKTQEQPPSLSLPLS
jgi:hypothetical protein